MKRQQASSSSGCNLPIIVIDDSTDEDTSVLISSIPPSSTTTARIPSQSLPIVSVSDDESADLNPSSPTTLPSSTLNFDDEEYSEYESSSSDSGFDSDEEAPNQYNIEDFLESLTREEERERLANRQQTPPPRVQYPSMASNSSSNSSNNNNNSFTNTNRINIPFHSTSRNNNPFVVNNNNNTNRNLLQQHRIQSTTPTSARTPIQAASRNRYNPVPTTNNRMFGLPSASHTNHPNQHLHHHFINNHHHNIGMPNHHPFQIFTDHGPPGLHRILEQHMIAQAFERSAQHHHQGGAHPLMFVNRDFDDRDYEMLLALDDNVESTTKKTAASVVGKLPIVHIEEKDCTCSICLEDLEQGSFASEIPFCNHKFHTDCIEKWLKDYGHTCPVCKQVVTEIDFKHAEKIKEENTNSNKRKGYTNKDITESKFKKKKVE